MNLIILLFLLGVALLALEVVTPGALLGLLGGAAMLAGSVCAFVEFGTSAGLLASAAALALLGLVLWLEFRVLPKTRWGRGMFVEAAVDSVSQPPVGSDELVGREGEALTTLAPSGYIQLEGRRYEAFSDSGHLEKGARVRVRSHDTFRIIVTKV